MAVEDSAEAVASGRESDAAEPRRAIQVGLLGALAAALPMAWLWGFTVDDALVSGRVAANVIAGAGYRFNVDGAVTDAVTPLGWAYVLSPFAFGGVLAAVNAARWLGAVAWLGGAFLVGWWIVRGGSRWERFAPMLVLPVCTPLAAWAVAGMETGVVTLLCTLALSRARWHVVAAGVAAAWRPELIPWATLLVAGRAFVRSRSPAVTAGYATLAVLPAVLVAAIRWGVFGSAAPLAVFAKPSDLEHGLFYVAAALLWTGGAWLVAAPWSIRRLAARERVVLLAAAAHCAALALAGGDWMSLFRLMVPVLPGVLVAGAQVAERAPAWATGVRVVLAVGTSIWLTVDVSPRARAVWSNRVDLIEAARPHLAHAQVVAALDVGWVGAATRGRVVDLAGITDPEVAKLPGGHTSKKLPPGFLRFQQVDALVLALPPGAPVEPVWHESFFERVVEHRVAAQASEGETEFGVRQVIAVGETGRRYLVLRALAEAGTKTNVVER